LKIVASVEPEVLRSLQVCQSYVTVSVVNSQT
jgi:hypothetical protein